MDIRNERYLAKNISKIIQLDDTSYYRPVIYMEHNDLSKIAGTPSFNLHVNQKVYFYNDLVEEEAKQLDNKLLEAATEIDIDSDDEIIKAIMKADDKIMSKFYSQSTHVILHPKHRHILEKYMNKSGLLFDKHVCFDINIEEDTILVSCIDNDRNLYPAILVWRDNKSFLDIVNPDLLFKIIKTETIE